MQRHMPMVYKIVEGKAEIIPETAQLVKTPSWSHCSVGKILEIEKYMGDALLQKT